MKKHNLLKVIGIAFLVLIVLTWIIPAGTYSGAVFTEGKTAPLGIIDIIELPLNTIQTFIVYGLIFVVIGGFYGVINKTGAYTSIVDKIVKSFKGKENKFLILTILVFALLSSVTGLTLPLFVLVPFFVAVLLLLRFSKITTLASTFGAILVGSIGSTYGLSGGGYVKYFFNLNMNDEIFTKIILLAIVTFLLIVHVLKTSKAENVKEIEEPKKKTVKKTTKKAEKAEEVVAVKNILFYEKQSSKKKSALPLVIISSVAFVLILVGMYSWSDLFGITLFSEMHESLMEIEINGYPIFANLYGSISAIGQWYNYELAAILIIASMLIAWIYSISIDEYIEGFVSGAKKMLPTALYAVISGIIFYSMLKNSSGNISFTITNAILGSVENFSIIPTTIAAGFGSLFYNDFSYLLGNIYQVLLLNDTVYYSLIGIIFQSVYGLVMLLVPTSLVLVAGLAYMEVSYKEWVKYIWKYLVKILAVVILISIIISAFI